MADIEFLYGYQVLREIILHQSQRLQRLFLQQPRGDTRAQELLQWAQGSGIPVAWVSKIDLDRMVGAVHHQGMVAQCSRMGPKSENWLMDLVEDGSQALLLLILDGVKDPHNLGACIRTANAMGAAAVVIPKDRAVGLTDAVHKTACGATAVTPLVQVTNLARTLRELKERQIWLIGLDMEGDQDIAKLDAGARVGLVMGGEEEGLRRLTREQCDFLAHIPMRGSVDSLNVSVAAAIALWSQAIKIFKV